MSESVCPHCNNPSYDDDALSCIYCGESLERDIGVFGKIKYGASGVISIVVTIGIIAIFIMIFVL